MDFRESDWSDLVSASRMQKMKLPDYTWSCWQDALESEEPEEMANELMDEMFEYKRRKNERSGYIIVQEIKDYFTERYSSCINLEAQEISYQNRKRENTVEYTLHIKPEIDSCQLREKVNEEDYSTLIDGKVPRLKSKALKLIIDDEKIIKRLEEKLENEIREESIEVKGVTDQRNFMQATGIEPEKEEIYAYGRKQL